MAICTHDGSGARDGHRPAEVVGGGGVGALQLGHLFPAGRRLVEHVRLAGVVGVVAGTHDDSGARDRHRGAEFVAGGGIGALQLGHLFPAGRRLVEHVRPAGVLSVTDRAHDGGRAGGGHREAEEIAGGGVGADQLSQLFSDRRLGLRTRDRGLGGAACQEGQGDRSHRDETDYAGRTHVTLRSWAKALVCDTRLVMG